MGNLEQDFATPPMKAPGFLFRYFQKRFATMAEAELQRRQDPLMDRYTVLAKDLQWDDLRLKKDERRFIDILGERSWRFREVFTVSNFGRAATTQLLLALIELGALGFVDTEDARQTHDRWRKQLGLKWDNMENQNPFEVLEIHWTSRTSQVEAAFARLKKEYEGFGRGQALPEDLDALRLRILDKVTRSWEAVRDTARRQEERKKHYEPQQLEFSAELLFKQGEMLIVRGRWPEVIDNFERAVELMPNVSKYKQFLENARRQSATGAAAPLHIGDEE
jgi:tetratricopeptide (TPR) repeat protein